MDSSEFKKQLVKDIDQLFMNIEEFGETHLINGEELPCQIQEIETGKLDTQTRRSEERHYDGIFRYRRTLFIKKGLTKTPVKTTPITIDGRKYIVDDLKEEMGIYIISLGRFSA